MPCDCAEAWLRNRGDDFQKSKQLNYVTERMNIMSGGNGTGPAGLGPMIGWAAGFCAGYPAPIHMNPIIP